jgi:hypothetical protein
MLYDMCPETPSGVKCQMMKTCGPRTYTYNRCRTRSSGNRFAFRERGMASFDRQEVLRGPSFGIVQILVRYLVSLYMAFVPQLKL